MSIDFPDASTVHERLREVSRAIMISLLVVLTSSWVRYGIADDSFRQNYDLFPFGLAVPLVILWGGALSGYLTAIMGFLILLIQEPEFSMHLASFQAKLILFLSLILVTGLFNGIRSAWLKDRRARKEQAALLALLGHEVKSPLMAIRLASHSLSKLVEAASGKGESEHLRNIERSLSDIGSVLDRCLKLDTVADEVQKARPVVLNVRQQMIDILACIPESDRVTLYRPGDICIRCDPFLFRRMVGNLLENAVKYSPEESEIIVRAFSVRRGWHKGMRMEVTNQVHPGVEIDPQQIFVKHQRSAMHSEIAGTGVGLWLVKEIVQTHAGSIFCRIFGDKVTFTLSL